MAKRIQIGDIVTITCRVTRDVDMNGNDKVTVLPDGSEIPLTLREERVTLVERPAKKR